MEGAEKPAANCKLRCSKCEVCAENGSWPLGKFRTSALAHFGITIKLKDATFYIAKL